MILQSPLMSLSTMPRIYPILPSISLTLAPSPAPLPPDLPVSANLVLELSTRLSDLSSRTSSLHSLSSACSRSLSLTSSSTLTAISSLNCLQVWCWISSCRILPTQLLSSCCSYQMRCCWAWMVECSSVRSCWSVRVLKGLSSMSIGQQQSQQARYSIIQSLMSGTKISKTISVAVRMRPLLHLFQDQEAWTIHPDTRTISSALSSPALSENININNSFQVPKTKKKQSLSVQKTNRYEFVYDHAFGPSEDNQQVYQQCCRDIVGEFVERGRNGTIFMYGQTTSGKTYTMLGDQQVAGLIGHSLRDICGMLHEGEGIGLCISYLEIYNEQINDLLSPGSVNLKIIDDRVYGAKECEISTYEQALELLQQGEEQRSYSEKKYHDHSSRSHTIFQIKRTQGKNKSVLNLVDLAGSERLSDQESNQETGYINKSLFVLSNVIHRLASGKKNTHIPYRDSKLTRMLAPSLSGYSSTAVICTVSPAAVNFYQTLSTLRFAACSRKVELKPYPSSLDNTTETSFINENKELVRLREENEKLRKDVSGLSFTRQSEQNFLECKLREIGDELARREVSLRAGWDAPMQMLCREYRKNIDTLQKEYTKALINAISTECGVDRQALSWAAPI